MTRKLATSDSSIYRASFYGILNAEGEFWTPLAFESERAARDHLRFFWRHDPDKLRQCLRTHKAVPVRIQLTALASVDTLPKGGDGEAGSVRSKGSAVPAEERADAEPSAKVVNND